MLNVVYKQKDGTESKSLPNDFTGYQVSKYVSAINKITEYKDGNPIGTIKFRPTKTPVIFTAEYGGYNEMRYSNGATQCIWNQNGLILEGEYRSYSTDGNLASIEYFHKGNKVTEDIKSFLDYTGDSFDKYKLQEDEVFNLCMLYGSKFKFYNEYKWDSGYFDEVAEFCMK